MLALLVSRLDGNQQKAPLMNVLREGLEMTAASMGCHG